MPSKKQRAKAKKQKKVPQQKVPVKVSPLKTLLSDGDFHLYFYKGTPVNLDLDFVKYMGINSLKDFTDYVLQEWGGEDGNRDSYIRQLEEWEGKIMEKTKGGGVYDANNPPITDSEAVLYCANVLWLVEKGHLPNNNLYGYLGVSSGAGRMPSFHGL